MLELSLRLIFVIRLCCMDVVLKPQRQPSQPGLDLQQRRKKPVPWEKEGVSPRYGLETRPATSGD